jgi:hypothetical protein
MATYCFKCRTCGATGLSFHSDFWPVLCTHDDTARDYRAESVGVQVAGLKFEREAGGAKAVRDKFLPTAKDYVGPGDPDGGKGLREWADTHDPKPGNKNPSYPDGIPKRSW